MKYGYMRYVVSGFGVLFVAFAVFFAVPEDCRADLEGIVGAWLLDDISGGIAKDASGNGHDGEVIDAAETDGKFGNALEFGPANTSVIIPHSDDLTLEVFTVMGWVRTEGHSAWQTIMTKTGEDEGAQPRNYGIFVVPNDGGIHFSLNITKLNSAAGLVDNGEWHLVVMTRDEDGILIGYIDGEEVVNGASQPPGVNEEDLSIGAGGGGTRYWLIGAVDEVAIFDNALSADEIGQLMDEGLGFALAVSSSGKLAATWGGIKVEY